MSFKRFLWLGVSAGLLSGCAASTPEIKPEWVARVPQDQMGPIYEARTDVRRSEDEVTRATVDVGDANRKLSVQQSLVEAAKARTRAADKGLEAAQQTGNPSLIADARAELKSAREQEAQAKRRIDAAKARIDFAQARRELAEARAVRASAQLEQTEFQVLQETGDTRVQNVAPSAFQKSVQSAAQREQKAYQQLQKERNQLQRALQQAGQR